MVARGFLDWLVFDLNFEVGVKEWLVFEVFFGLVALWGCCRFGGGTGVQWIAWWVDEVQRSVSGLTC